MVPQKNRERIHPIGIDLGTTYSCVSQLNSSGQPVAVPNSEGELSTPSVVLFDGDDIVVGTEALRNAVSMPDRVVTHAKRFMGDLEKNWVIDRKVYRPQNISAFILRKLLDGAEERLGRITRAVITVPAQFSDLQRQLTIEAGLLAGLKDVDIINEPVAAAMCHVLSEGMWFAELANDQTVLVFDLGGGTFDLSLVKYNKDEVKVIASGGDLRLGGLDWNRTLEEYTCDRYVQDFISDPRLDKETMQALSIEIEQLKRSLSVRHRGSVIVQHEGRRKTFAISREQFEKLSHILVDRTEVITRDMLKEHGLGWAHVNAVLVTGGASRMPMIRNMLKRMSGTTLNTTLSPDQSIAHGAAYYAGMLLSGEKLKESSLEKSATARLEKFRQQSVTGRGLGILIRDPDQGHLRPHYLIPANTPLPCAFKQRFGTVTENQKRVHLHIVESGATLGEEFVELGNCQVDGLPPNLPIKSPIEVTIHYNEQGRVRVTAVELSSGVRARASIIRPEAKTPEAEPTENQNADIDFVIENTPAPPPVHPGNQNSSLPKPVSPTGAQTVDSTTASQVAARKTAVFAAPNRNQSTSPPASQSSPPRQQSVQRIAKPKPKKPATALDTAQRPIPLCNTCGNPIEKHGACPKCGPAAPVARKRRRS